MHQLSRLSIQLLSRRLEFICKRKKKMGKKIKKKNKEEKGKKRYLIGNWIPHETKRWIRAKKNRESCFDIWILMTPWHPYLLCICFRNVTAGSSGNYWISTFIEKQHIQYGDNCPVGELWRIQVPPRPPPSFCDYRILVIITRATC